MSSATWRQAISVEQVLAILLLHVRHADTFEQQTLIGESIAEPEMAAY
jgi:hypothetical protein